MKTKPKFEVRLERGVWLADWEGDPGRTVKRENSKLFDSVEDAEQACKQARKYRPFKDALILYAKDIPNRIANQKE